MDAFRVPGEMKIVVDRADLGVSLANFLAADGITYEVWRVLDQRYESKKADGKHAFDVIGVLHRVYNDIEKYGMVKGTGFSKSWMCPALEHGLQNVHQGPFD